MSDINLYAISKSFNELMLADEVAEEEKEQALGILAEKIKEKSAEVIGLEKNMEYAIQSIKFEEDRLKENRRLLENKLERYKGYIQSCMNILETNKIETARGSISLVVNPISVEIVDEDKIPNKYKKQVIETKIDKAAIARDFKNTGEIVEGVNIINDKKSLRFK